MLGFRLKGWASTRFQIVSRRRWRPQRRQATDLDPADWVVVSAATPMALVEAIQARPSASMPTTPCQSWPKARRARGIRGFICAPTSRWAGETRRRRPSSILVPATMKIRQLRNYTGQMQADAYAGSISSTSRGSIIEAASRTPARRNLLDLAGLKEGAERDRGGSASMRCPLPR
jgi:hypothetical protein